MGRTKKLMALGLAAAMVMSLGACGKGNTGDKSRNETSGGVTEITVPTYLAGENVGALFFLPQVERFNAEYEGQYKIIIEEVPQASYTEKIKQLAQQNKLPVIVHSPGSGGIDPQWFKQVILDNDLAYDLTEFAADNPEVNNNWVPESVDYCTIDGKLICKPLAVLKPIGLFYNSSMYQSDKDIRDQSMDEFISSLGDNKLAFQTADNGWTTGLFLSAIINNIPGGNELLAESADEKLWDYNHPIFIEAIDTLKGVMQNNAASNSIGAAYADAANAFMSESASIICNGSWMTGDFSEESSDKWSNNFKGDDVKATIYPGNIALANPRAYGEFWIADRAADKEKELAMAFFAFRDSQDEIEALLLAEGGVAPQLDYSDEFRSKQKESRILYEAVNSITDDTKFAISFIDVMPASVADVEFGKLLPKLADGTISAEEFCQELTLKAEEAKQ